MNELKHNNHDKRNHENHNKSQQRRSPKHNSSHSMSGSAEEPQSIKATTETNEAFGIGLLFFGSFLLEKQLAQLLIEATEKT